MLKLEGHFNPILHLLFATMFLPLICLADNDTEPLPISLEHISGYASVGYTDQKSRKGSFQVFNFSPIVHFLYDDKVLLESELELGYAEDGSTEANLEYAALDFFLNDYMILVGGQFLSPIGSFRQNINPSWINKLPSTPFGFSDNGAAPLAATGFQLRGGFPVAFGSINYAVFIANPPKLVVTGGEMEVITEGINQSSESNKTVGGRIGILPMPNLEIGLSAARGEANIDTEKSRSYNVLDADIAYQPATLLEIRGEIVRTTIDSLATSSLPDSASWQACFIQVSRKFFLNKWEAVLRFGRFEYPSYDEHVRSWTGGINYLLASNAIAKVAYEYNEGKLGTEYDRDRALFQLAFGF